MKKMSAAATSFALLGADDNVFDASCDFLGKRSISHTRRLKRLDP
jgi:hypothetical protein